MYRPKNNDYKLSRYACYLIVQNADPNKEVIVLGQSYFAIKTRKQELLEKNMYLIFPLNQDGLKNMDQFLKEKTLKERG